MRGLREAQVAASLDHHNVVPVFGAGDANGLLYLAMRYVEGTDLAALLASRGSLPAQEAARVTRELGAALDAAHAKGLVHRDIKPSNVLIAGAGIGGHIYLSDFGLTKETEADTPSLTQTGHWVGTIDYVSPEQLDGHTLDARSDVYALGCLLFQMLSGRVPFEGTHLRKMWGHATRRPLISTLLPRGRASVSRGWFLVLWRRVPATGTPLLATGGAVLRRR